MTLAKLQALTCAVRVTIITYALTFSSVSSLHVNDAPQNPTILQVTDDSNSFLSRNALLGTATEQKFKSFIQKYGKNYSTREEYVHRLRIFAKNMMKAAQHQLLDPTAVHGVTPFSDLSEEEFERFYTGMRGGPAGGGDVEDVKMMDNLEVDDLPESFDWREKGAVTEVKMQVYCTFFFCFLYIVKISELISWLKYNLWMSRN